MALIKQVKINGEYWWVAHLGLTPVLRNRYLTGCILDCWELGITTEVIQ